MQHDAISWLAEDCSYYITSLAVLAAFTYNQVIQAWEAGHLHFQLRLLAVAAVKDWREIRSKPFRRTCQRCPSPQAGVLFAMYIGRPSTSGICARRVTDLERVVLCCLNECRMWQTSGG